MKCFAPIIFIICFIAVTTTPGWADTRYVADTLVITVRTGQGTNYQIIETLKTGTKVQVLEEGDTYLKVRTPKGNEGYALTQYISSALPKSVQIEQLKAQISSLQGELAKQQEVAQTKMAEASSSEEEKSSLSTQLEATRKSLHKVQDDYELLLKNSQNVISLSEENEALIEQNKQLNNELLILREENSDFHRSNMIQWFLAGGGVFFFGWLIGKISRKKQRGFSRF